MRSKDIEVGGSYLTARKGPVRIVEIETPEVAELRRQDRRSRFWGESDSDEFCGKVSFTARDLKEPYERRKLPAEWAAEDPDGHYDCTSDLCQLGGPVSDLMPEERKPRWPMYSFDRPSFLLWNAIAGALHKRGWSDRKIKVWLQSKHPRWALDNPLGDSLERLGKRFAKSIEDDCMDWFEED
jgi:hypothetical protein